MQIEETFRDLKSPQYGIGLRHCKSRCPKQLDVLLLIAMLAEITLWLIGIIALHLGLQKALPGQHHSAPAIDVNCYVGERGTAKRKLSNNNATFTLGNA